MMPARCLSVARKRVDFPLTPPEIQRHLIGRRVFTSTDYIVLESGGEWAIVEVGKRRGLELLREIVSVRVLSLPAQTGFVRAPDCDVHNPHSMARIAVASEKEAVVVLGKFEHVSFIIGEKRPPVLRVIDFVPPRPSKTMALVESALESGAVEAPLLVEPLLVDALELVSSRGGAEGAAVMFPCEAGRMELGGREVIFLDKAPPLPEGPVLLAGCALSRKTFRLLYRREPIFIDICPRELARRALAPGELGVARCCDVHRPRVEGGLALVPYGATVGEVSSALSELLERAGSHRNALNQGHR
ncbi:MAG: DUF7714 family protein [Thermoplasmatota archaeon]